MTTPARTSLLDAFNELVVERQYQDIHISDIIHRADVSRSTFYEHFGSKELLLKQTLVSILSPLAPASCGATSLDVLERIVMHLSDVRSVAQVYFRSPLLEIVTELLSKEIQETLETNQESATPFVPANLLATQLAAGTLGLIKAWLAMSVELDAADVAKQILIGSRALIESSANS
ncbi:MAG: TetR/AcrR family transcriptional regulator [Planctomycetota bacterium]